MGWKIFLKDGLYDWWLIPAKTQLSPETGALFCQRDRIAIKTERGLNFATVCKNLGPVGFCWLWHERMLMYKSAFVCCSIFCSIFNKEVLKIRGYHSQGTTLFTLEEVKKNAVLGNIGRSNLYRDALMSLVHGNFKM